MDKSKPSSCAKIFQNS